MNTIPKARHAVLAQAVIVGLLLGGTAWAQPAPQAGASSPAQDATPVDVDIPAQSLRSALDGFAHQTGLQVVYAESDVASGLSAPAVKGTLLPSTILQRLLAPSKLHFTFVNKNTVTVFKSGPGNGAIIKQRNAPASMDPPGQSVKNDNAATQASAPFGGNVTQLAAVTANAGIARAQMQSIQLKRSAPNIEDSITAEDIGRLPDLTIAGSLQRVPGVQINRTAGEGSTVNIRGLPQVRTLLNGGVFLSAANINSVQPNFNSTPPSLFAGVDVYKSPTANMFVSGISGTINLRTRRPWDMPFGNTSSVSLRVGEGSVTHKIKPNVSALFSHNADGRWGFLVSASYSKDESLNDSNSAGGTGSAKIVGENLSSALSSQGFVGSFTGAPVPSDIHMIPGGVDVNSDGKHDLALISNNGFSASRGRYQRERLGLNASFQMALPADFTLVADGFYTNLKQYNSSIGMSFQPAGWEAQSLVPLEGRNTGIVLRNPTNTPGLVLDDWNQALYTTNAYKAWPSQTISATNGLTTNGNSRDFDVALKYDQGGPFKAKLKLLSGSATQQTMQIYDNIVTGDGSMWPNDPANAAPPGMYVTADGNRYFNKNGFAPMTLPVSFYFDKDARISRYVPSAGLAAIMSNPDAYALKTIQSYNDDNAKAGLNVIKLEGSYDFNNNLTLRAGLRNNVRTGSHKHFNLATRLYAGEGASDPNGCLVRQFAADVLINGGGVAGTCTAGNADGYYRGQTYAGIPISKLPSQISDNWREYHNLGGVQGLNIWAVDPKVMRDAPGLIESLYGPPQHTFNPPASWAVSMHTKSAFVEGDFKGELGGFTVRGNAGARVIKTNLDVHRYLKGTALAYGIFPKAVGMQNTVKSYTDILPAVNLTVDLTSKLLVRFAGSKNMVPLDLDQWGGGLNPLYELNTSIPGNVFSVVSATSSGNPDLKPWRSTNSEMAVSYYFNRQSMISVSAYRIKVASFIKNGTVRSCDIPDLDGVQRRCVSVTQPVQGQGQVLKGYEFQWNQAMTFLPGFLSNTGFAFNWTLSNNDTGERDLAGHEIPFQDNSKRSGNLVLWYQGEKLGFRIAGNYRSKRAVQENVGGIQGLEAYQAPQFYLAASVTYSFNENVQIFLNASNLTKEHETYYLVWRDQPASFTQFERRYMAGVRITL